MGLDVLEPCSCLRVGDFKRYLKELLKLFQFCAFQKLLLSITIKMLLNIT